MTPPKTPLQDAPPASVCVEKPERVDVCVDYAKRVVQVYVNDKLRLQAVVTPFPPPH